MMTKKKRNYLKKECNTIFIFISIKILILNLIYIRFYRKKVNICGHEDKEHYAKGMCNNCYHRMGRTKKPWKCGHAKLYANGYC